MPTALWARRESPVSSGKEVGWTFCGREMFLSLIVCFVNRGKARLKCTPFTHTVFLEIYINHVIALIKSRVISLPETVQGQSRLYVFRSLGGFRSASTYTAVC